MTALATRHSDLPAALQVRGVMPTDLMSSYQTALDAVLVRSDRAWRKDRRYQRMMRHDPDIAHAIGVRELAGVLMTWRIKPEDEDDLEHRARCLAIQKAVNQIPHFVQARGNLAKAPWYGTSGSFQQWSYLPRPITAKADDPGSVSEGRAATSAEASVAIAPVRFDPIPFDGIRFTAAGDLVILISTRSDRFKAEDGYKRVMTDGGPGVIVPPEQRTAFLIATWNIDPGEPDDYTTAERVYAGQGLRSLAFDAWLRKQFLNQKADEYAERFAGGNTLIKHNGSKEGEDAAQAVLDQMGKTSGVTIPPGALGADEDFDKYIKIVEPAGTGNQILRDMAKDAAETLKLMILGQTLTTETAPTGLGSGVADAHENTFDKQIEYDVTITDEALSRDLIAPMWRANFPDDPRVPQFVSQIREDEQDVNTTIDTADKLVRMGVTLAEGDLRDKAGFREPQADEPTIGGPGGARSGVDDLFDGLADRGLA